MNPLVNFASVMLLSVGVNSPQPLQKSLASIANRINPEVTHSAAMFGTPEQIEFLSNHGFDLRKENKRGYTPLDFAMISRNHQTAAKLIESGNFTYERK